jgi:hypothetical protein
LKKGNGAELLMMTLVYRTAGYLFYSLKLLAPFPSQLFRSSSRLNALNSPEKLKTQSFRIIIKSFLFGKLLRESFESLLV